MDIKEVLIDLHDQFLQHEGSIELFAKSLGLTREQAYQLTRIGEQLKPIKKPLRRQDANKINQPMEILRTVTVQLQIYAPASISNSELSEHVASEIDSSVLFYKNEYGISCNEPCEVVEVKQEGRRAYEVAYYFKVYKGYLLENNLDDDSETIKVDDLIWFVENEIDEEDRFRLSSLNQ